MIGLGRGPKPEPQKFNATKLGKETKTISQNENKQIQKSGGNCAENGTKWEGRKEERRMDNGNQPAAGWTNFGVPLAIFGGARGQKPMEIA
jgi:hypothetical protein